MTHRNTVSALLSSLLLAFPVVGFCDRYIVTDPRLTSSAVMSLVDGNVIQRGGTALHLDRNQTGAIYNLRQGDAITGTGAFELGSSKAGTDVPMHESMAGTRFAMPQLRYGHSYHLVSPDGDASAQITVNGIEHEVDLPHDVVVNFDAGSTNGTSTVISSTQPILVSHRGLPDGNWYADASPIPPAATELWGVRSTTAYVSATEDNTRVTVYSSSGTTRSVTLNTDDKPWAVPIGSGARQGAGSAIHVVADKPVSAIQWADGDGVDQTAFYPTSLLKTHFGIPKPAQYVAVACPSADTTVTLRNPGSSSPITRTCNANGNYPGKAYFGSTTNVTNATAPIKQGASIESNKPIHVIYEVVGSEDEHNLVGMSKVAPGPFVGWQGYDDNGANLTAAHAVLDLSDDITGMNLLNVTGDLPACGTYRRARMEHMPSGGYFHNGTTRFIPGSYGTNCGNLGQHYAGIGQINNFREVGDSTRVTVGYLVRWSRDYLEYELRSAKQIILVKAESDNQHQRPMAILWGGTTTVLAACNGTVCNTNNTPDNQDNGNDNGNEPNIRNLIGKWVWVEFQVDTHGPYGEIRTKIWDQDGIYDGATISQRMTNGGGRGETYGGHIQYLDILGGYMESTPASVTNPWYELERVEIVVGSDADLTPPTGFPGSRR